MATTTLVLWGEFYKSWGNLLDILGLFGTNIFEFLENRGFSINFRVVFDFFGIINKNLLENGKYLNFLVDFEEIRPAIYAQRDLYQRSELSYLMETKPSTTKQFYHFQSDNDDDVIISEDLYTNQSSKQCEELSLFSSFIKYICKSKQSLSMSSNWSSWKLCSDIATSPQLKHSNSKFC